MGIFDIFKKPVHEKYAELIHGLREYYKPLRTTKVDTSIFSMTAKHFNNIDNLTITIYKGSAYNERSTEYSHLNYDDYVFVKTTYSVNGETIIIRNAFPKNGNQILMFTSVIGAELMKTGYELESQHQKEVEKKKEEEVKIKREQEKLEKLKNIRQEIESSCQEELSEKQKIVLVAYLCEFTGDSHRNKIKYCMLFNLNVAKLKPLILIDKYNILNTTHKYFLQYTDLLSIRNRNAVYTFIHYCSAITSKRESFIEILKEWGFQDFEIEEFVDIPPTLPEINIIEDIFNPTDISSRQKAALSNILKLLSLQITKSSIKIEIVDIINSYRKMLGIPSEESIDWAEQNTLVLEKDNYIQSINTIEEVSYIEVFLFIDINIIKITDYDNLVIQYFKDIVKNLSYTKDAIQIILNKKFSFEWTNYIEDLKIIGIQSTNIVQSWSLLDFAREYGKPKLAHCKNRNTEEEFTCIAFGNDPNILFVAFSPEIGELTVQEIIEKKYQLKVAKQVKEGKENYILYE